MKSETVFVFLDANLALHFRRPDQIDWKALTRADRVVLVAAPVFLYELEYQKSHNPSHVFRERARQFTSWMVAFVRDPGSPVRLDTHWLFLEEDPVVNPDLRRLEHSVADDRLIASVSSFRQRAAGAVCVATNSVALEAKLRLKNIEPLFIPEEFRLSSAVGTQEREVHRGIALKPKPSLSLTSLDDSNFLNLNFVTASPRPEEGSLAEILERYPEWTDRNAVDLTVVARQKSQPLLASADFWEQYTKQRETFLNQYSHYLREMALFNQAKALTAQITCILANDGAASALDIEVVLTLPADVDAEFLRPIDLPIRPQKPETPEAVQIAHSFSTDTATDLATKTINAPTSTKTNGNANTISFIRGDRCDIRLWIGDLKHGCGKILEPFYIRFKSVAAIRSFTLPFTISGRGMSEQVVGQFDIVAAIGRAA